MNAISQPALTLHHGTSSPFGAMSKLRFTLPPCLTEKTYSGTALRGAVPPKMSRRRVECSSISHGSPHLDPPCDASRQ